MRALILTLGPTAVVDVDYREPAVTDTRNFERFELELLGGSFERRYRKLRPEIEAMPWGTFVLAHYTQAQLIAARHAWTAAAFQEHRTGIACCATLRALLEARAPLDLTAVAARFPLDEIAHAEMCARLAMELGGGTEIVYDPLDVVVDAPAGQSPLFRLCDLAVRFFCVGEALSIPLLRAIWHAACHPLPRAVLGRIVRDEAAHGTFGYAVLDWALPQLSPSEQAQLGPAADRSIASVRKLWEGMASRAPRDACDADTLAFMETDAYLELAARSMDDKVLRPLRARGLMLQEFPDGARSVARR